MWKQPWRYRESIAIVSGIVLVGFALQLSAGKFNFTLLGSPVNLIVGGVMLALIAASYFFRKKQFFRWFTGVPMAVTLIGALLVLALIMGLTTQTVGEYEGRKNLFQSLGFDQMTSSWPFVLVYFTLLLSLGMLIVRRLVPFRWRDYSFYLNHIGLWLLLFSAGLGSADMRRYVMHIREGEVEWRVFSEDKKTLELPIAIRLNDFRMEEYPPNLAVIDRNTGAAQPEPKPVFFHIDEKRKTQAVGKWEITLKDYIHEAVRNSDSTYHEVHMPGASPAAKVKVSDTETGGTAEGWVSAGNISQLYMVLNIDSVYCVAMTQPEPKRFVSDIEVFSEDGKHGRTLLEVNKPFKIGSWMLYQYGYDTDAGKLSTFSSIELVYDPWIVPVYIGIILFMLGSVCMLWSGSKRKEVKDDVE